MHRILVRALLLLSCGLLGSGLDVRAQSRVIEDLEPHGSFVLRWGDAHCWEEHSETLASVRCVTNGRKEDVFVATHEPWSSPQDLRGHFLEAWIRVDDVRQLAAMELRVSSDNFESNYFAFQIPMFGDPQFNVLQDSSWIRYTFSFSNARVHGSPNRARINAAGWLIHDRGQGGADVAWSAISAVRAPKQGAVSLTFDDGSASQLEAARAMARHDFPGTAYIIPDLVGAPDFMRLEDLVELRDRHRWEIAAHHGIPLTEMQPGRMDRALLGVKRFLELHGFHAGARHFAYPLGKIDAGPALAAARKYFDTARLAASGPETLPPADPHTLRVMNVINTTPPEEIAKAARAAVENGDWLILMFHHVRAPASTPLEYDPERFARVLELLDRAGIEPETVGAVWDRIAR